MPKTYGEKGKSRVRVWEPRRGSNLMIAYYGPDGKLTGHKSLGHRDWSEADAQAAELVALLERARLSQELSSTPRMRGGKVRLGPLVDLYLESASFKELSEKEQVRKGNRLRMLVAFFGEKRDVSTLDEDDIKELQRCRKKGIGVPKATGQQSQYADFSSLRSVLRWACRTKNESGDKLLKEYPLFGVSVSHNNKPRQVLIHHDTFHKLKLAARRMNPLYRVFLLLVEATGRRMGSVLHLEWEDVDFEEGTVRWQAEKDKMGTETVVAMSRYVSRLLRVWRRMNPDTVFVFQKTDGRRGLRPGAKLSKAQPYGNDAGYKWIDYIFEEAQIEKPKGAGWHSLRRKWVTERKDLPRADVMAAGGWKSESAFSRYEQPDPKTTRVAVERPAARVTRFTSSMKQPHETGDREVTAGSRNLKGHNE